MSDSELNDFQRVKFKNTISKIPRILDWVFYNVAGFEINFFWQRNYLGKNNGWKSITFWLTFSRKRQQFCLFVCIFKMQDCGKTLHFSIKFWIQTITACQILNSNFKPVRFRIKAFRTRHTLDSFFSDKIRSWKNLRSEKPRIDSFSTVRTTSSAFCSHS